MNKQELKKILKPLIKECIKEVIFEDGTLSSIIAEVMRGVGTQPLIEQKKAPPQPKMQKQNNKKLQEQRKQMLDAIGKDSYNGVSIFEGTTPTPSPSPQGQGPLAGTAANDPGIDIGNFTNAAVWKKLAGN